MGTKTCLKCGSATPYDDNPPAICPDCGAIYAKVEAARAQPVGESSGRPREPAPSRPAPRSIQQRLRHDEPDVHGYAERMREQSLYPAWRKIVGFFTLLGYIVAALTLVGGVVAAKGSPMAAIVGVVSAAVIALLAKVGKELSLMLADLSDATVRLAASREDLT